MLITMFFLSYEQMCFFLNLKYDSTFWPQIFIFLHLKHDPGVIWIRESDDDYIVKNGDNINICIVHLTPHRLHSRAL